MPSYGKIAGHAGRLMLGIGLMSARAVSAADWTGYRGPQHDGSSAETGIAQAWTTKQPKVLWKVPIGPTFGTFAAAGDRAFIFVADEGNEGLLALDAKTGQKLWAQRVERTITDHEGGSNPRSTPTVDGDKVYVLATGQGGGQTPWMLDCFNAATGKPLWHHDLSAEFGARQMHWGNAASPVIDGELLYVAGGGAGKSLMAFNKQSGKLVWGVGDEKMTHASPVPTTLLGVRQVIFYVQSGLVSVDATTGKQLWRFPFTFHVSHAADPVVGGDMVYVSAGYGSGSVGVQISKEGDTFHATQKWRQPDHGDNVSHWSTPVYHDGYLYGIFGFKKWGDSPLKCVKMDTGEEVWRKSGFGSGGGVALVDGHLLVQSDTGRISLVEASPAGFKEVASFDQLHATPPYGTGAAVKCWQAAILANGHVLAHTSNEAICFDVSGK